MAGVSLFLNQIPIFALLSLAGGTVLCALSGAIYHARSLQKNDKSKDTRNQPQFELLHLTHINLRLTGLHQNRRQPADLKLARAS